MTDITAPAAQATAPTAAVAEPATVDVPGFPAGRAQDFKLPFTVDADGNIPWLEDRATRAWLVAGGFPVGVGNFIVAEIQKVGKQHAGMSAPEKEVFKRSEVSKLTRKWGEASTPENLGKVRGLVLELDERQPGFAEMLVKSGAVNSSVVLENLFLHAGRLLNAKYGPNGTVTKREQAAQANKKAGSASAALGLKNFNLRG